MFVGDISLGEHFFSFGHGPRSLITEGSYIFEHVHAILSQADFVIGNLEGPLSDKGYNEKDPFSRVFRGSPDSVAQLRKSNINILNIANNHVMQHGSACFAETVELLQNMDINVVGQNQSGTSLPDEIKLEFQKIRLGILAASEIKDNIHPEQKKYQKFDLDSFCKKLTTLKERCDLIIVLLHWGIEGDISPTEEQISISKKLIKCGANLIIGHHPHVFYPITVTQNNLIAYSLGNFVFDLPWDKRLRSSGILDVTVSDYKYIENIRLWPVSLNRYGQPFKSGNYVQPDRNGKIDLYSFKNRLKYGQLKKMGYFLSNFFRGSSTTKLKFITWKIKQLIAGR